MPDIVTTDIAPNSLYQANLFKIDNTGSLAPNAEMRRFDLHKIRFRTAQESRLGPVYATEEEMHYGPRHVDEAGLKRIRTAVAERSALPIPSVPLQ